MMELFAVLILFRPERGHRRATYQVSPHHSGVPPRINGPQEAQQQGVAHPLGPVVAAVALPATAGKNKQKEQNNGPLTRRSGGPRLIRWILFAH